MHACSSRSTALPGTLACLLALAPLPALAQPLQLDDLHVRDSHADATGQARQRLEQVPGAVNLITAPAEEGGASTGAQDLLKLQPGIHARSAGNEGIRLSIRGSGINRGTGAHGSGVFVLLDGLPLSGPGGTPYELQEPLWLERAEVLRGANGFELGAASLGGAVNLISPTGRDAAPLSLRYEIGSHGWQKRHIALAAEGESADAFVALTDSRYDGYQKQSAGSSEGVMANVGYRFNHRLETRFHLRYRETEHQTPGRLSRRQIDHDPRAAQSLNLRRDSQRPQPGSTWLANTTRLRFEDGGQLDLGLAWHDYPMDLQESSNRVKLEYSDVSASLRYSRPHELFGLPSRSSLGWRGTAFLPHSGASEYSRTAEGTNANYPLGSKRRDYEHNGSDSVLTLANELELLPDLWLSSGLALIYTRREVQVTYPAGGDALSMAQWDYAPRLGLRYQLSPQLQVFGNLSRSVEAPHAWSMLWSSNSIFPRDTALEAGAIRSGVELDNQTATTLELGGRGDSRLGQWELAWYYSHVRHELLNVERLDGDGNPYVAESNASPTIHQGIEAGLQSRLWQDPRGELTLRQAYTWSRFHYRDDQRFGDNALPGLPEHFYQAELRYQHHRGWYLAANALLASRTAVDYANSFNAGSYKVFGAQVGYRSTDDRWLSWLEVRNIGDERYAATVQPGYDDRGQDIARSSPGEGRAFYSGIRYSWF